MLNILVTGASGIIGYGILRSLRICENQFNLIGSSIYKESADNVFSNQFELAVSTSDSNYTEWLKKIISKHAIDIIIPGIEDDVYKLTEIANELDVKIVLNSATKILNDHPSDSIRYDHEIEFFFSWGGGQIKLDLIDRNFFFLSF